MDLVSVIFAGALGALVISALTTGISNVFNAQTDAEVRAELFESLKDIKRLTNCSVSLAGLSGSGIDAAGTPIELKMVSSRTLIGLNGTTKGRFSFVADVFPDNSIRVRAALFRSAPANPRSELTAKDQEFRQQRIAGLKWNWTNTTSIIDANFSSLRTLCGGSSSDCQAGQLQLVTGTGETLCASLGTGTTYKATGWSNVDYNSPVKHAICVVTMSGTDRCGRCYTLRNPDGTWHISSHSCSGSDFSWCTITCY